jgi:hypothetical protein
MTSAVLPVPAVMKYPGDWAALIDPLRARVGAMADILFGIGA